MAEKRILGNIPNMSFLDTARLGISDDIPATIRLLTVQILAQAWVEQRRTTKAVLDIIDSDPSYKADIKEARDLKRQEATDKSIQQRKDAAIVIDDSEEEDSAGSDFRDLYPDLAEATKSQIWDAYNMDTQSLDVYNAEVLRVVEMAWKGFSDRVAPPKDVLVHAMLEKRAGLAETCRKSAPFNRWLKEHGGLKRGPSRAEAIVYQPRGRPWLSDARPRQPRPRTRSRSPGSRKRGRYGTRAVALQDDTGIQQQNFAHLLVETWVQADLEFGWEKYGENSRFHSALERQNTRT